MSDSVQPHRRQPTRLPHPWDSPGKNTGVGCHFLLQCRKVTSGSEVAQSYPTLSDPMDCSLPGTSVHGIFHAKVLEWVAIAFSIGCLYVASNHNMFIECLTKKTTVSSNHAVGEGGKVVLDSPGSTPAPPAILSSSIKS